MKCPECDSRNCSFVNKHVNNAAMTYHYRCTECKTEYNTEHSLADGGDGGLYFLRFHEWAKRLYGNRWREIRRLILSRDGHKCIVSGHEVTEKTSHIHHRLALSQGGTNHSDNLETRSPLRHEDAHPFMRYVR